MVDTILEAKLPPSAFSPAPLPKATGVGLKSNHVSDILETRPDVGFFEVHAENYMGGGGVPHAQLRAIREHYPLSLHGVGMSIGSPGPLNKDHLARFRRLVDIYQPGMVSEHLAWSTHTDIFYNDLLPVPYTDETLARVVEHVDEMQEAVGRQILIENPSTYVTYEESTWDEVDFMAEIAKRSGCGLLFDVNNVFVSTTNHEKSATEYIDAYPLNLVQQIHLAGHTEDEDDDGRTLLIDTHDKHVTEDVWQLYERTLGHTGRVPTLVEWDSDLPEWPVLKAEADKAGSYLSAAPEIKMVA